MRVVPSSKSNLYKLLNIKPWGFFLLKDINSFLERDSVSWCKSLRDQNPGWRIISFHHSPIEFPLRPKSELHLVKESKSGLSIPGSRNPSYSLSDPRQGVDCEIEIPAVYSDGPPGLLRKRRALVDGLSELVGNPSALRELKRKYPSLRWTRDSRFLVGAAALNEIGGYMRVADSEASARWGLLSDKMAVVVAKGIHHRILPGFKNRR